MLRVDLKITVNDTTEPIFIVNYLIADVIDIDGKPFPIKSDEEGTFLY